MSRPAVIQSSRLLSSSLIVLLTVVCAASLRGQSGSGAPRRLELGASVSMRLGAGLLGDASVSTSVRSTDSTLHFDPIAERDVLIGLSATVRPFERAPRVGLVANVQVLSLASGWAASDDGLQGGVGASYHLSDAFSVGVLLEVYSRRQPRRWVRELEGTQLRGTDGDVVTTLAEADDRYFLRDSHRQLTLLFTYSGRE